MMKRREFLGSAAAVSLFSMPSTNEGDEAEIIARSRDRQVRYEEVNGEVSWTKSRWVVESRHTGDTVYSFEFPRELVAHSYASSERVFVAFDPSSFVSERTFEWFLQSDCGRSRKVNMDGETRIIDYYADGAVVRRV